MEFGKDPQLLEMCRIWAKIDKTENYYRKCVKIKKYFVKTKKLRLQVKKTMV